MTKNIIKQLKFYKDILKLDILFAHQDSYGLGMNKQLFIILREDKSIDSHHLSEHKGPVIMSFKCNDNLSTYKEIICNSGYKIRDELIKPEYNANYLFIEDHDGNELCLDFSPITL